MKKLSLFLGLMLVGCVGAKDGTYRTSIFNPAPPQVIRNEKCEDVPAVKIFQVLDNFALAFVCESYSDSDSCFGMTVYVPKKKDSMFYDGKIIRPEDGECISFNGTYKYQSKDGMQHTVPKIKMADAEFPNPEYEQWEKEQQEKSK